METGGDNRNIGERELHQTSQLKEQEHGSTNISHLEAHISSSSLHEPTNTDNKTPSAESSSQDQHINATNNSNTDTSEHEHQGSEIQNPPVQVMERPGESPQYIFPSHVFSKSNANSTVEWSTASNESLFSIYMGNTSFSSELVCFKSCELDKPGDLCTHDQPNASPTPQSDAPVNKFNDISKRTQELHEESSKATEAKAAETMREVIMESSRTTENIGKGDDKASNSHRKSNGSANSYAFQSSKGRDKSVSSKGAAGEKQNQQKQSEENETPNAADQAPESTTNAPNNKWLNCFSCCTFCS